VPDQFEAEQSVEGERGIEVGDIQHRRQGPDGRDHGCTIAGTIPHRNLDQARCGQRLAPATNGVTWHKHSAGVAETGHRELAGMSDAARATRRV
jgi:hypothetical protein